VTRRLLALITGILLQGLLVAGPARAADSSTELAAADEAFRFQDYERAISHLRPLVDNERIDDVAVREQAMERLAASLWFTDEHDGARTRFAALLKEAPDHRLDPLFYPQELLSFFETEKQRLIALGFIGSTGGTAGGGPRFTLVRKEIRRPYPTANYLMPFGIPQMLTERRSSGTLHAVLQGLGLAANIAAWIQIESLKADGAGVVPRGDGSEARLLEKVWWVGTGVFAASYAYSVTDGLVNRLPALETRESYERVDPDAAPPPPGPDVTWRIGPAPGGLGLGVGARF
jgi:hypothetical protein